MEWNRRLLIDFDDEREAKLIQIEILDWIGCEKVGHGRRYDMLLVEDWLKVVELGPPIGLNLIGGR